MIALGGICVGAALFTGLFVSDARSAAPRFAPPDHGCALPFAGPEGTA